MEQGSTTQDADGTGLFAGDAWFDPIEAGIRDRVRGFIQELLEQELTAALGRNRCKRTAGLPKGYRNGTRERQLLGSFGPVALEVPRARMAADDGGTHEWRSQALPRYARMTRQVEALIAGAYLSGTNTRRVKRALAALFGGAVGKDVVSRTWRKVKVDWEAWNKRDLADEDVVRLILDGTVVRVRLDRKATNPDNSGTKPGRFGLCCPPRPRCQRRCILRLHALPLARAGVQNSALWVPPAYAAVSGCSISSSAWAASATVRGIGRSPAS